MYPLFLMTRCSPSLFFATVRDIPSFGYGSLTYRRIAALLWTGRREHGQAQGPTSALSYPAVRPPAPAFTRFQSVGLGP